MFNKKKKSFLPHILGGLMSAAFESLKIILDMPIQPGYYIKGVSPEERTETFGPYKWKWQLKKRKIILQSYGYTNIRDFHIE